MTHNSRLDQNNFLVGRCAMDVFKGLLDDDEFKFAIGHAKNEVPNCDVRDHNDPKEGDQDLEASIGMGGQSNNNIPDSRLAITEAGNKYTPSCANHAQYFRNIQLRSLYNLGNIRPELNDGESSEAKWLVKQRENKIKDRAANFWRRQVKERNQARFNSGATTQATEE